MAFGDIINPVELKKYLELWITEDISDFDFSSIVVGSGKACANIEINERGVFAGIPFVEALFKYMDCTVEWKCEEGCLIETKRLVAKVSGPHCKLLMAEKVALNILSHTSGIATVARRISSKVKTKWQGDVSNSRLSSPGMKMLEKYALYVGGIKSRCDLSSTVIIRENYIKMVKSVENSVGKIKEKFGNSIITEVECNSKQEAIEAARVGVAVVRLNNFKLPDIKSVSKQIKDVYSSVLIEVNGRINENNIMEYAITNVDIISSSIFCQGYKCIEFSMNIIDTDTDTTAAAAAAPTPTIATAPTTAAPTTTTCFTPEKFETVKDVNVTIAVETKMIDINDKVKESVESNLEATSTPKAGVKRKVDEISGKTEDNKTKTTAVEISKKDIKKPEENLRRLSPKSRIQPRNDKSQNKMMRLNNTNKADNSPQFPMKNIGLTRMPGYPVNISTPRAPNGNNLLRAMAAGLTMSYPGANQSNDAFFRGAAPIRYGGTSVIGRGGGAINNLNDQRNIVPQYRPVGNNTGFRYFCKNCNYQNPANGPPMCRICRNML